MDRLEEPEHPLPVKPVQSKRSGVAGYWKRIKSEEVPLELVGADELKALRANRASENEEGKLRLTQRFSFGWGLRITHCVIKLIHQGQCAQIRLLPQARMATYRELCSSSQPSNERSNDNMLVNTMRVRNRRGYPKQARSKVSGTIRAVSIYA